MKLFKYLPLALALCSVAALRNVAAQPFVPAISSVSQPGQATKDRSLTEWLLRLHEAPRKRAYMGTLVVSSGAGALSSARIWHVCDGEQQIERVETLTGPQRSTFRRNNEVIVFLPESGVARSEHRESMGPFPNFLKSGENAIPEFYSLLPIGSERVAGLDADVVQFVPGDRLRFGYRIWSEKKTGLVIKLQTLDRDGRVLEQAAFSELQLDAPVKMQQLAQLMGRTDGYKLEKSEMLKTTPIAEGWSLRNPVPGFRSMSCSSRPALQGHKEGGRSVQWVFSDGLATVSLFVETFDRQRHLQEGVMARGATHMLTRHLTDKGSGSWWLTAVGEVPVETLQAFSQNLERRK
jgi:sigma-E factor negative regulatory protein RseB